MHKRTPYPIDRGPRLRKRLATAERSGATLEQK